MIIVIGERINAKHLNDCKKQGWLDCWNRHGWEAALRLPAHGGSLSRLEDMLPDHCVVNLLPPDNKCGAWDRELARKVADQATLYFGLPESRGGCAAYDSIVLLGKRVAKAFLGHNVEFGHIEPIGKLFALCMPHPSGRSRFWNDPGARDQVREWVRELRSHLRTPGPYGMSPMHQSHKCLLGLLVGTSTENHKATFICYEKGIRDYEQRKYNMPHFPEYLYRFNFCPGCGRKLA